jgi:RND family efflux transporter MFP subunit
VDTAAASSEYVVCTRNVAEGEMVRTMFAADTATLFKLVIDCTLKLKAWVPERHRGEVKVGQEAAVRTESYPGEVFAGRVSRVSPSVDEANRSFQIEITVPNEDHRLSPGGFANVSVLTRADLSAPTVPEEAIVSYAGVTKVYAIVGGVAREFHVRTGQTLEVPDEPGPPHAWVEVVGSLPADATVVTSGQSQLADGVRVRVRGKGE